MDENLTEAMAAADSVLEYMTEEEKASYTELVLRVQAFKEKRPFALYVPLGMLPQHHSGAVQMAFHNDSRQVRLFSGANQCGKTVGGAMEAIFHATGEYPPWYKGRRLPQPTRGRIVVSDIDNSARKVIGPTLDLWAGKEVFVRKEKNARGVYVVYHCENGSRFDVMGNEQEAVKHEGVQLDWCWFDEPPRRDIWIANVTRMLSTGGLIWLTLTPLKEPWIYDEIWERTNTDAEMYALFIADIAHNAQSWGGFLPDSFIARYSTMLTEDEKEARLHGRFRHLAGLIYKAFPRADELIDDFDVPFPWTVLEGIDPHDARPTCVLWWAVDPEGFHYVFDFLAIEGFDIEGIAQQIKLKRAVRAIDPFWTVIDAKYSTQKRPGVSEPTWRQELARFGIPTILSQSDPGSVNVGHKMVEELRRPRINVRTGKEEPLLKWFRGACNEVVETSHGRYGPLFQMQRYTWDSLSSAEAQAQEKPRNLHKDFPDILRYIAMKRPQWVDPSIRFSARERAVDHRRSVKKEGRSAATGY